MPVSGPTVVRRQVGRRLRKLREESGRSETDVERANLVSRTKLWRIESGKVSIRVADVRVLCWFYGVDADQTDALAGQAMGTVERGWWETHGDVVPEWFKLFVGMEGVASQIRSYDGELVPGQLQTEDYSRAVYAAAQPEDHDEDVIKRHVAVRRERQEALLQRDPAPLLEVVLGEGALARQVGGRRVMDAQIAHLRALDRLAHIRVRVLPNSAGAHAAMVGAFRILDFRDVDDPSVVYLETQVGGRYLEKESEIAEYRRLFELIKSTATGIEEYS